ncbi:MAG: SRPBCC family protein [Acidobacteria bacterium]|nr:SRPBCC family protein [Acidobacteriota bacterium]
MERISGTPSRAYERPGRREESVSLDGKVERLAKALGWFSIGLGVAEVVMPSRLARLIGVREHRDMFRTYGVREIGAGAGILTQRRPSGWLWARVAGDALDLASLGAALASKRSDKNRVTIATAAVAGVTAADVFCAIQLSRETLERLNAGPTHITDTIIVNRSPEDLYSFWRDFRNLPQFMKYVRNVQAIDDRRSHWTAQAPGGRTIEWDAEIMREEPNHLISWHSVANARIETEGTVRFERAPGGRGTLVKMEMHHSVPGGVAGGTVAKLFSNVPRQMLHENLRRFKRLMETGEIPTVEGQPSGPRTGKVVRLAESMNI